MDCMVLTKRSMATSIECMLRLELELLVLSKRSMASRIEECMLRLELELLVWFSLLVEHTGILVVVLVVEHKLVEMGQLLESIHFYDRHHLK